jgi:hypothetical protein
MTEEQREILRDLEVVVAVLEVRDNTYCINKLTSIKEKLKKEWEKN